MSHLGLATDLEPSERYCRCCEKRLRGKIRWLELDQRTNTFHDHGNVQPEKSQGWFPFGLACARRMLAEHAARVCP